MRSIAELGVRTYSWTFVNRQQQAPRPKPHVRLTAPSGAIWEWNEERADERVEGDAVEFCQVVTQSRTIGDTGLAVTGENATLWIIKPRDIGNNVAGFLFADDRDTIVGFLAGKNAVITDGLQLVRGKPFVWQFGFLQRQHIRLGELAPGNDVRETDIKRVDIP